MKYKKHTNKFLLSDFLDILSIPPHSNFMRISINYVRQIPIRSFKQIYQLNLLNSLQLGFQSEYHDFHYCLLLITQVFKKNILLYHPAVLYTIRLSLYKENTFIFSILLLESFIC
jgi:hypothetical protein